MAKEIDPVATAQIEAWDANFAQTKEGKRMNTEQVSKIVDLTKKIKAETMDASIWDDDENSPMMRIQRIDDLAWEILHELGVEGFEH